MATGSASAPALRLPARPLGLLLLLCLLPAPALAQAPLTYVDDETTVRKISFRFVGGSTLEEDQLREQIATAAPTFWDQVRRILPFVSAGVYPFDPIELQKDVVRLRRYYRRSGFLHPTIDYPASQLDTTSNKIHVVFSIREGPPLIIQDVGFYSPTGTYAYELFQEPMRDAWIAFRDATTVEVGTRFTEFDRVRIPDAVQTWLRDQGFAFARVETEIDVDSTANTVDLRFRVDPGPRARVEAIVVEGNESVPDRVVQREVPLRPGDWFSHRRMLRGQRELFSLNLFRLALADLPEQPVDSSVVVRYRVREAQLRYLSAETGYAADDGATLLGEWRHRNFFGGARQFTASALYQSGFGATPPTGYESVQRFNATLALRQPYLLTSKLSGILSPFYTWEDNPNLRLRFHEVGFNTTLLYEIYPFRPVTLQHTFSRSWGDTQGLQDTENVPGIETRDIYNRSVVSASATLGKVDDFLNAQHGFLVRPFAELATSLLRSDVEYAKVSSEVTGYYRLGRQLGLRGRLFAGYLWPFGESDVSDLLVESRFDRIRFYAGGANDVRGWPSDLLGEVEIDTVYAGPGEIEYDDDGHPRVRYDPLGGLGKLAANVELRLPLPGLSREWSTAVFLDAGQVYPTASFDLNQLQYGTGAGIRYETIVGFIRLDVAYKLNPRPRDLYTAKEVWLHDYAEGELESSIWNRFRIHLSIGQAF